MDVGLIPNPEGIEKVFSENGDTEDIIKVVLKAAIDKHDKRFCKFASQFPKSLAGLRELWSFVKYRIPYRKDPAGRQDILLPAALFDRGWGDCKSKTVFIVHVLQCMKIPFAIRFTSYAKGPVTHVYPVAFFEGEEIIIDSVYDFFNREKAYVKKKDYDMTKISMISGLEQEPSVKEGLIVLQQKRSLLSPQPEIPLSGSIGEARAFLLRRQLEMLRTFNIDNREKAAEYGKALENLDSAIVKGILTHKVSALGNISQVEAVVNHFINTRLKDPRPALAFGNTAFGRIASIGATATTLNFKDDLTFGGKYKLGYATAYEKTIAQIQAGVLSWLSQYKGQQAKDSSGQPVFQTVNVFGNPMQFPVPAFILTNQNGDIAQTMQAVSNMEGTGNASGLFDGLNGIRFGTPDYKAAFEKYVEEQSGVWQQYLQQTAFREQSGVGGGVLYDYATGVPGITSLNQFPGAVSSKKVVQSQWLDGAAYLTGAESSIVRDLARNTYIYVGGENPEDSLAKLLQARGIGFIDPGTIGLIITAITTVVGMIIDAMAKSKRDADQLSPQKAVGFAPVGPSLMPAEGDWTGENETAGAGGSSNLLLLAALAAGGYYFYSQSKK